MVFPHLKVTSPVGPPYVAALWFRALPLFKRVVVDKQPFVFLAFLRKAMFLGIHPDIFHVVRKIVFIPYPMV